MQLSVGPELFYVFLLLLEETGFLNASLYTPFGIAGVETLGYELAEQVQEQTGRKPDAVVVTHAGGGNLTGTARGLRKAGCTATKVIGVSVDLSGLHMASDGDFNRKPLLQAILVLAFPLPPGPTGPMCPGTRPDPSGTLIAM